MFEKFTKRARKVMSLARQEAQRLEGEFIGTEHILLGIFQEGGGVAARVLKNLNLDLRHIRQEIEKLHLPSSSPAKTLGQLPFSPRARRVIELAAGAAGQLGHDYLGTEHLLLGLLKEHEGRAAQVLSNLGLKLAEVRDLVLEVLGAEGSEESPSALPPPPSQIERNLFDRAHAYLALADRPALEEMLARLLQQGRSVALVGPKYVGKTSLVFALSRAKAGDFAYWSIDHRIFDEFHRAEVSMPRLPGTVCFVPEAELLTASRSPVADLLDERRRGGEHLLLEFREGGFEAYSTRFPDLAKELARVDVHPPDARECALLLESARPRLRKTMGIEVSADVLGEADRLARARWPKMVAPWATLITIWKAAAIRNETNPRGDILRVEKDIAELERSPNPEDLRTAEALRLHAEGLRGVDCDLTLESVRQAIGELADRPGLL
jgi:ATP-dependent Clp protease ATP-binding subunit ClpA